MVFSVSGCSSSACPTPSSSLVAAVPVGPGSRHRRQLHNRPARSRHRLSNDPWVVYATVGVFVANRCSTTSSSPDRRAQHSCIRCPRC
jgi:hypothetical protein